MSQANLATVLKEKTLELMEFSDTPKLDARVLMEFVLKKPQSYLFAHPELELSQNVLQQYDALIDKRCDGVPVAYLTGQKEFWSLALKVNQNTLIPRPETELLVESALHHIPDDQPHVIADLGCGSGAIALALAKERPQCRVIGTDNSPGALTIAQENQKRLGIHNCEFRQVERWLTPTPEVFHMIVSNPPYIADNHPNLTATEIRYEPQQALASGPDGLNAIREIAELGPAHLVSGGWLLLEHGYDQEDSVESILVSCGFEQLTCHRDLAGLPRVTQARRP